MAKTSWSVFIKPCIDCGQMVTHRKSSGKRCRDCQNLANPAGKSPRQRREGAATCAVYIQPCRDCLTQLVTSPFPAPCRCGACHRAALRAGQARSREGKASYSSRVYIGDCSDCGTKVVWRDPKSSRCGACRTDYIRAKNAARMVLMYATNPTYRLNAKRGADLRRMRESSEGSEIFTLAYIAERDRWVCGICGCRVKKGRDRPRDPDMASLDHVVPLSVGGTHTKANAQLTHLRCNLAKNKYGGGEQLALVG